MAPRAKSAAFIVDGVQCSVDLKSRVVTVGSRLVGNDEHDRFKLPVGVPIEPRERLEAQVSERAHGRPKFAALAARAARADPMPMQVDIDKVVAAAGSAGYQPATEVLVCRPRRNVQVPVFLQPSEALCDYVTGSRKRKRPAEEPIADDGECCKKPACAAARAERGKLQARSRGSGAHAAARAAARAG